MRHRCASCSSIVGKKQQFAGYPTVLTGFWAVSHDWYKGKTNI
jgi:hypothetical protein